MVKAINLYDALYDALDDCSVTNNPFEQDDVRKSFFKFCNQYIYETEKKFDDADDGFTEISNIICNDRRNAFKVGFETAVLLIVKGGNISRL